MQPHLIQTAIPPSLRRAIDAVAINYRSVEDAELAALAGEIDSPLRSNSQWTEFREALRSMISDHGYAVVRGLTADEGRSLLILSAALGTAPDSYAPDRVVKRFRMSPWTTELSHTTRAGEFHTDGNVALDPPAGTAIQCELPDPDTPAYGEQRVVHLPNLIRRLSSVPAYHAALSFLTQTEAVMGHERTSRVWRGILMRHGRIRFHPESLRVAARRFGTDMVQLESALATIHRASMESSVPFHTNPGDALLVSNTTALHYRGACSVRFTRFPMEYYSRSVLVLHVKDSTGP